MDIRAGNIKIKYLRKQINLWKMKGGKMQGVEILNKIAETEKVSSTIYNVLVVICIMLMVITVAFAIVGFITDRDFIMGISVILLILSWICGVVLAVLDSYPQEKPTGEYIYQVTISDEVKMNDFNNKYEIIKKDGKLYTVKERTK